MADPLRHDGEYRWILDGGIPPVTSEGSSTGYIGSIVDSTEPDRAEKLRRDGLELTEPHDTTAQKRAGEVLSAQSRRLLEAQEAERARIARELHDDIGQRLALLSIGLAELQRSADPSSELQRSITALSREALDIATDVQALSHKLHSHKLQLLGLIPAIRALCSEVSARHKVEVNFTHEDVPGSVRPDIALCLFRVVQEALQNGVRHSGAARLTVSLHNTPKVLILTVRDCGRGFNPESAPGDRGLGVTSMRERLKLVAGELIIDSTPGSGTQVQARVPLQCRRS